MFEQFALGNKNVIPKLIMMKWYLIFIFLNLQVLAGHTNYICFQTLKTVSDIQNVLPRTTIPSSYTFSPERNFSNFKFKRCCWRRKHFHVNETEYQNGQWGYFQSKRISLLTYVLQGVNCERYSTCHLPLKLMIFERRLL